MSKQRFLLKLRLSLGQGRSSRPPRTFAAGDGAVGLGIVAAMGALSRSQPMPISTVVTRPLPPRTRATPKEEAGVELSESYTCVISHLRGDGMKKTFYYGNGGVLFEPLHPTLERAEPPVAVEEALRFCFLCKTKLDGGDAYMYRGEKAFCSEGCRHQQMLHDEQVEKLGPGSPCAAPPLCIRTGFAAA